MDCALRVAASIAGFVATFTILALAALLLADVALEEVVELELADNEEQPLNRQTLQKTKKEYSIDLLFLYALSSFLIRQPHNSLCIQLSMIVFICH